MADGNDAASAHRARGRGTKKTFVGRRGGKRDGLFKNRLHVINHLVLLRREDAPRFARLLRSERRIIHATANVWPRVKAAADLPAELLSQRWGAIRVVAGGGRRKAARRGRLDQVEVCVLEVQGLVESC